MIEVDGMTIKSVVFFKNNKSLSGVLEAFTDGLAKALAKQGVAVTSYGWDEYENGKCIAKIAQNPPDCTIGFNILLPEDSPLKELNIPHYAPLCDCATYYPELRLSDHMLASFMEQDSYGFYKRLGVENIFFMPHAINAGAISQDKGMRDLDIVMAGSFILPEAISKIWGEQLTPQSRDDMLAIAERVLASPNVSHLQAFTELVEQHGSFEKELLSKKLDFFSQLNMLEVYIRNVDRLRLIQAIEGRTVHIFSAKPFAESWKRALKDKKNVQFYDEVPFNELPAIFGRARCVINSIPTIKRGLHERLLLALASGASVLGNDNLFIQSQFPASSANLTYLSPDYKKVNTLLDQAFSNEEKRLADVFATQKIIQENHTWDARAKTLIETLPPFLRRLQG